MKIRRPGLLSFARRLAGIESAAQKPSPREVGADPWQSERWPRTPRVIRWAWAGGLSVLVILQALGYGPQSEAQLLQLLDALVEELQRQERETAPPAPAPPAAAPAPPAAPRP